jgi:hypothetical protein
MNPIDVQRQKDPHRQTDQFMNCDEQHAEWTSLAAQPETRKKDEKEK